MQQFSEALNTYHKRSGRNTRALAELLGIDPSYLTKLKQGKFLPSNTKLLERMGDALCLSPQELMTLRNAYQVAQIGEDRYAMLCAARDLLYAIRREEAPTGTETVLALPEVCALSGTQNVERYLHLALTAAQQAGAPIRVLGQPTEEVLRHAVFSAAAPDSASDIFHICMLQRGGSTEAVIHNLRCITAELPMLLRNQHYYPSHCYEEAEPGGTGGLLPNLVVTDHCVVEAAADWSDAVVHTAPGSIRAYAELFDVRQKSCRPTARRITAEIPEELCRHMNEQVQAGSQYYALEPCACCALGITRAMAEEVLSDRPAMQQKIMLHYFDEFVQNSIAPYLNTPRGVTTIFPLQGLRRFVNEGIWPSALSSSLMPRVPERFRAEILTNLLTLAFQGRWVPAVLNSAVQPFSTELCCESLGPGNCSIYYTVSQDVCTIQLCEPGIAQALRDYMVFLTESDLILPQNEALSALREARDHALARFGRACS